MMYRWLLALLVLPLWAAPAAATVGGDDHVELLGYEPVDGKLYYLEHIGGEGGEPPRLHFLDLDGPTPGAAVAVRSWYEGPLEAQTKAFPERLKALRARLKPLAESTLAGARLTIDHRALIICSDARVKPKDAAAREAAIARWKVGRGDIDSPACRPVTVGVRWRGHVGGFDAEVWAAPQLIDLRPLPGDGLALAVVRYGGKHYESGYTVDRVVLLRRATAPSTP